MKAIIKSNLLAILAFAMAPLIFRIILFVDKSISPVLQDVAGIGADITVSALIALLCIRLSKRLEWIAYLALFLWTLVNYAAFEYARVFDSILDFHFTAFLADPTFFKGSASSISTPFTLIGCLVLGFVLYYFSAKFEKPTKSLPQFIAVLVILLLSYLPFQTSKAQLVSWRTDNVLLHAITGSFTGLGNGESDSNKSNTASALQREIYTRDLSGDPIVELPLDKKPNVLMLITEGVSGAYLPSVRATHGLPGRDDVITMKGLDKIFSSSIHYSNFTVPQRQTDRGEYAILCGDYPKLDAVSPKMRDRIISGGPACLPEVMKNAGYKTVYLQAANLKFMDKIAFMPDAGFDESHGDEWFTDGKIRNEWGWDDDTVLSQSIRMIRRLNREGKSWFLVLLTVGTHHPFTVPEDFMADSGYSNRRKSFEYLDYAISKFYKTLQDEKLLDDTVLMITSDESAGFEKGYDDFTRVIAQNFGYLSVKLPGVQQARNITLPFTQSDISLSVLDLLGLADKAPHFIGRSFFRENHKPRPQVFVNTFSKSWFLRDSSDLLTFCKDSWNDCYDLKMKKHSFFQMEDGRIAKAKVDKVEQLKQVVKHSLGPQTKESITKNIKLCESCSFKINKGQKKQILFESPSFPMNNKSAFVSVTINSKDFKGEGKCSVRLSMVSNDSGQSFVTDVSTDEKSGNILFKFHPILYSSEFNLVLELLESDADIEWELENIAMEMVIGGITPMMHEQFLDEFVPICSEFKRPAKMPMQKLIAHAGGSIKGINYSNSLEALDHNYQRSLRWFEVDISSTSDNHLVLLHDWQNSMKKLFNEKPGRRSLSEFRKLKMNGSLTQMTLDDLVLWMNKHSDAFIVTDVKDDNLAVLTNVARKYPQLRDRFIPQIYNSMQYCPVRALGFDKVIFTAYRSDLPDEVIAQVARRYPLTAVTIPEYRSASGELQNLFAKIQTPIYTHTINEISIAEEHIQQGTLGFYTDDLSSL